MESLQKKKKQSICHKALEGIKENSLIIFIESAGETTFITKEKIELEQRLLFNFQSSDDKTIIKRDDFIKKLIGAE